MCAGPRYARPLLAAFGFKNMKRIDTQIIRNFLIAAGFYGIYYAAFQFVALIWRKAIVYDRPFPGQFGQLLIWSAWEFPYWLFCIISGFFIPYVIELRRNYLWAIIAGTVFTLHNILFTSVYYAQTPGIIDLTTRFINMISPLVLFPFGVFLLRKYKRNAPEQLCPRDASSSRP
jgi:hypothetical protein